METAESRTAYAGDACRRAGEKILPLAVLGIFIILTGHKQEAITYSNARKNLRALIRNVCNNAEPTIIVSNQNEEQGVLISLDDFQAMEETAYLLSSPANRAHLEKSLQEAEIGKFIEFSIEDL